ncbi:MAG: glycoside hydrolase family 97 catalytic domain-containing protein [Rikenellaceae bacterium]
MKNITKNIVTAFLLLSTLLVVSCSGVANPVESKKGSIVATLDHASDTLYYSVAKCCGEMVIDKSPLLIEIDGKLVEWSVTGRSTKTVDDKFDMVTGEQKHVELQYLEETFSLNGTVDGKSVGGELIFRLYDKAFAYRFIIENSGDYMIKEGSQYLFADENGGYFAPNGEFEPFSNLPLDKFTKRYTTPVIHKGKSGYTALHESDLHNYSQLYIKSNAENGGGLVVAAEEATANGTAVLPWRVVLIGETIADLHSQKQVYLSLSQPAEGDYSWVKPGFSTWDWRVKGCVFGGEMYEMTTKSLKRYIDFCARHNLDYFMVDAEWYDRDLPIVPVKGLDLEEVIRYGNEIGVGVIIYYDLNYMNSGKLEQIDFHKVCSTFQKWGAKGIKYGFLGSHGIKLTSQDKVNRCEELIKIAGQYKLFIDFHDHPIPHGGLERQYPNYLNREYCHAQMDGRRAFTPSQFTMMACVNLLAGPMDQTNGTYALNTIKSRSKGPRNEYYSTVAAETARAFITHTGNLSVLLDAPEAYEEFGDIFEFIASLPNQWDEAKYLEMSWGERVSIARRSGDQWFLGTVYGNAGGKDVRTLEFLDSDKKYSATIYRDAPTTDFKKEKETYEVEKIAQIGASDILNVKVANGGGYSVIFTPITK